MGLRGFKALSASTESKRTLQIHFDHEVSDEDRAALVQAINDQVRIDWLQERIVDTIYLDDGKIIDVRGNNVRTALDAARQPPVEFNFIKQGGDINGDTGL